MTFNLLFKIRAYPLCMNQELQVLSTPYHKQSKRRSEGTEAAGEHKTR